MKINDFKIIKRWNGIAWDIGLEHLGLPEKPGVNKLHGEVMECKEYYDALDGITYGWLLNEAEYWLSCYYESGNCRCDDRFIDSDCYKSWVSETGKLKRFINAVKKYDAAKYVIEW